MELMPEEAKLLVQKEVAYIVDDLAWHKQRYTTLIGDDKKKYLESVRSTGLAARKAVQDNAQQRSKKALARIASAKAAKDKSKVEDVSATSPPATIRGVSESVKDDDSLLGDDTSVSGRLGTAFASNKPYPVTPSTSYSSSTLPQNPTPQPDPSVPLSYSLFSHLHSKGYYIMPGLRFGCDYNVYPGDPLRFHSHFLATSYEWDQEIPMIDVISTLR